MNFEEVERNTTEHIIRHYSNTSLNVDYTCFWCYPPPSNNNLTDSFIYFWVWFNLENQADTYSARTTVAFNLFKNLYDTPESEYRNERLKSIIVSILSSIRYRVTPFSFEVLYFYIQGVAFYTNCFERKVTHSISRAVYTEILDQDLLQIQRDRELLH